MLCSWQINAAAGLPAADSKVLKGNLVSAVLKACDHQCETLRIGYIRVMLPITVAAWRLDLVFSPSNDTQNVVLLTDSNNATAVAEPFVVTARQWRAYIPFPGVPCSPRFDQGSLRLICSPLPVADWSATIDLDIYTPNPTVEPCQ